MRTSLLLSFIIFLFLPVTTLAQQYYEEDTSEKSIEYTLAIGPRLGYYKAVDADNGNLHFGAQGRMRLGEIVGVEGTFEYRAGQDYENETVTSKASFVPVTISPMIFIPVSEKFLPYLVGGIGLYYTMYDYDYPDEEVDTGFDSDNSFNFGSHLGLGTDIPLAEKTFFNVDYRYLFLDRDEVNLQGDGMHGHIFTMGLIFYL